jgi:adenylate cyclase, class 2
MHTLEFKAELRDPGVARAVCRTIGAHRAGVVEQTDTYFRIPQGRFKKRESIVEGQPQATEYIHYDRTDRTHPKLNHYTIYSEQQAAQRFGTSPLPIAAVVHKRREVYRLEAVTIHLDDVDKLGRFIEFESIVTPDHNVAAGHRIIADLRKAFESALGEALSPGYLDLMLEGATPGDEEPPLPPHILRAS